MFDRKSIDEYQSIVASTELKERVMSAYHEPASTGNNVLMFRTIMIAAASLILVITASLGMNAGRISVAIDGNQMSMSPYAANEPAISIAKFAEVVQTQTDVPICIKTFLDTKISVSNGTLHGFDSVTGEQLSFGNEYQSKGDIQIYWNVDYADGNSYVMELSNIFWKERYILEYDSESDKWSLCED